jgi:hypothetical protein
MNKEKNDEEVSKKMVIELFKWTYYRSINQSKLWNFLSRFKFKISKRKTHKINWKRRKMNNGEKKWNS